MLGQKTVSDQELIQALKSGGAAKERYEYLLYRLHMDFVRKRPRKYKLTDEEARDAYTDAFLIVIDHITSGRFRGESSIKTYLSRIFRNKCVDRARKNSTIKVDWMDEFPDLEDTSKDFLRKMIGEEMVAGLRKHLEAIGEKCKELLLLSGSGFSPQEVAEKMGFKTPKSASSQRYKCMEKLKQEIEKYTNPG
ncbi:MAG: sigma-70 family RNA polymerase sigma factor [Bacteroidetes bacterium]|nr:sigma-70 family RNA polymerase sigma factor [Bacteroidota bacterium]MCB0841845.1 sigma-70 family RNA polymerase sigma factor [Bacteroidota bacterium]